MTIISDKNGQTDSAYHTLVKHIKSDVPIVMVSWSENFVFNDALLSLKEYCLVCFCEYGWDYKITDSHIWGQNTVDRYYTGDWVKFDNWVKANPFKVLLKRELLKKDVSGNVRPIEYPCISPVYPLQSKTQFYSRPINAFQYWGRSNENRMRIHGEIWLHAYNKGFQPCDNIYYLNNYMKEEHGERWVSLWIPHYQRIEVAHLLSANEKSKLSLSWEGAGFKCFRTMESPVNSVMVMHKNELAWSHDWDETNCVLVDTYEEVEQIDEALKNDNLYSVYLKGVENVNKYRLENYLPFLESIINKS